jgi:hypothetical protein
MLPWSAALRERFGFETPPAYRALESRALFRWSNEFRHADLSQPGDRYLLLNDMEWYQPDDLRTFEFESYHKPGFMPFAFGGNGDYWCWYPAMEDRLAIPVLLCPHDCSNAYLYAPDFASALYRHALQYAAERRDPTWPESEEFSGFEDEDRGRMLKRFAIDLAAIWPREWCGQVEQVSESPLEWSKYNALVNAAFGQRYADDTEVRWMKEDEV